MAGIAGTLRALACAAFLASGSSALAAPVLDQEYNPFLNINANIGQHSNGFFQDRAQTFTVGITGILSRIEMRVFRNNPASTGPLLIDVRTVSGGVPFEPDTGAGILESHIVAGPSVSSDPTGFVGIDLSGIAVAAGDVLAIAVRTSDPLDFSFIWGGTNVDLYAGGAQYNRAVGAATWGQNDAIKDLNFRTFVEVSVPAPGAAAFLFFGAVTVALTRCRRRGRDQSFSL